MILDKENFDELDEEFFEYGLEKSGIEELSTDQIRSWFDIEDVDNKINEFYWVKAPFVFAGTGEEDDMETYTVFEPELSEGEENTVDAKSSQEFSDDMWEVSESLSEYLYNSNEWKLTYPILKDRSGAGDLYPLFIDDNIVNMSVQEGENAIVSLRDPSALSNVMTDVSLGGDQFNEIFSEFESKSEDSGVIKSGYIDTDIKFQLSESSTGKIMNFEFYGSSSATVPELIVTNMLNARMGAYLWYIAESNRNIIVGGANEAGKTTVARALLDFVPKSSRVLAVGDGKELANTKDHLQHYSWDSFESEDEFKMAADSLPEYMIFDNISDGFGSSSVFTSIMQGKTVWATMDSPTLHSTLNRLSSEPINASEQQIQLVDVVINIRTLFTNSSDGEKLAIKRFNNITEIVKQEMRGFKTKSIYERDPATDEFTEDIESSNILANIREERVLSHSDLLEDMEYRTRILQDLVDNEIFETAKVRAVIRKYRNDKDWLTTELDDEDTSSREIFETILEDNGLEI